MDVTLSSFFHTNNFDAVHNSKYRFRLVNGMNSIMVSVWHWKTQWGSDLLKQISGSWNVIDKTA
jgi:hypothetical protein